MHDRTVKSRNSVPGRVLIVHSSDEMYGADRILLEVVNGLRDGAALDVVVWLPLGEGSEPGPLAIELTSRGVAVSHHDLPILRRSNLSVRGIGQLVRAGWRIWRELRRCRFPVVYLMTSACLPVAPLARLSRTKHVVLHLQEMWSRGDRLVLRPFAWVCSLAIAISQPVAAASRITRRPALVVVENGIAIGSGSPSQGDNGDPDEIDPETGPVRYLVASRWNAWKGHRTLLEAWERAGCPGDLTVVGAPPPVGAAVDVRALVRELVTRPATVKVVGQVDSIDDYLDRTDALILPSDRPEPFGLVVIEAFGHGRPALASRGGGPMSVITEGVDGWLFDLGSAAQLADLLRSLDRPQLRTAGEKARLTYVDRYTPESYRRRIAAAVTALWL